MSYLSINGGTFDASNININKSNLILTQNYGINGGISDISGKMFNITNSSINITNPNSNLALNNTWTGKNIFTNDVSINNTNTQINSTSVVGLSGGVINISGGTVNIGGSGSGSTNITSNNIYLNNIPSTSDLSCVSYNPTTKRIGYVSLPQSQNNLSLNNQWTGTNTFTNDVSLNSNVYAGALASTPSDTNCVSFNPSTKKLGYTAIPAAPSTLLASNNTWAGKNQFGGDVSLNAITSLTSDVYATALASTPSDTNCVSFNPSTKKLGYTAIPALLPSNNQWTGTNTFNNNVSFNNTTTQINSTSVVGLSGGVVNISGGIVNIGGNTTTSIIPHNLQTVIKSGIYNGFFGMFTSLSSDGNTLAVGSPYENNSTGAVRIYIKSGSSWIQQGNTIVSGFSSGIFGGAVSLSSDGNALVVGSENENSNYGKIRVYVRDTITKQWGFIQVIPQSSPVNYGKFVSLSSDGKILAVAESSFINIYDRDTISSGFGFKTGFGGNRVVVSPNGNTIAIGTTYENSSAGAVRVYIKNTSTTPFTWSLQTATPITTGISSSNFGCSLAFSYDGTTLAVGSQTENNYGAVRVYVLSGSNWNLQTTTPLSSGFINSIFGFSISISYDGNLLAVGSSDEDSANGAVRLYSRNTSTLQWSQQGNTLLSGFGGRFGRSVSLSSDGNTLAAGADRVSNDSGSVLIFVKQVIVGGLTNIIGPIANTLTPYTQTSYSENSKLVLYDNTSRQQSYYSSLTHNINPSVILHSRLPGTSGTQYGSGVVISGDGKTMAISAPLQSSNAGAVYIYVKTSSSTWTQQIIITSSVTSVYFGKFTAISYDGNTLAIGSHGDNSSTGSVSVYVRTGTTWTTSPPQFFRSGYSTDSWFGYAVALSSDGNTMAVGSFAENNYYGAVRVYGRSGINWTLQSTSDLTSKFTVNNEANLGRNISLSSDGNTLAVGSFNENSIAGAVRIYVRNSSTLIWDSTPQFYQPGYSADSAFCVVSLSSDGNTLAVGSVKEPSGTFTGAVRVYVRQPGGTSWTQQGYFTTSISGSYFGTTVVVSYDGNTIVVGSMNENNNSGAVRIYTRDTTLLSWSQLGYIITSDYSGGQFGASNSISISADGNTIVVGSPLECAVRVYSRNLQLSLNVGDVNSSGRLCVTNRSGGDYSRFQTDTNNVGQRSGIEFGIPSFTSDKCSKIVSTTYDYDANDLQFYTNTTSGKVANSRMTITKDGYVGIGTTNPNAPLQVASTTGTTIVSPTVNGFYAYSVNTSGAQQVYTSGAVIQRDNVSIYCNGVVMTTQIAVYSDKRIKTNIVDIDDEKALSILRKIQPKTYEYVDKFQRGNANVIGFIAQEIKEIIPKAVSINKDYVPTFYTICQVSATDASNIVLVSAPIDLSWNPLHDQSGNAFVDADGNACSDASGNKCFNVKLYDQNNNEIKCKTTNVLDKRSFLIESSSLTSGDYFLYGQEVDDFHALNKDAIFTVVTAAVQDIDRIVQNQQVSITDMSNIIQQQNVIQQSDSQKIQLLEGQVATLNAQLSDLQNKYSILENNVATLLSNMQQQQQQTQT